MNAETAIALAVALYAGAGLCAGAAFVTAGVDRVLAPPGPPRPVPFTLGARLLILPGAVALWPYVLLRWRRASRRA